MLIQLKSIEQILQKEIEDSQRALNGLNDDTIYGQDHRERSELINWVLEEMKKPDVKICESRETKMNEIISVFHFVSKKVVSVEFEFTVQRCGNSAHLRLSSKWLGKRIRVRIE